LAADQDRVSPELELTDQQREQLGLGEQESLQLLHSDACTVTLRRSSSANSLSLPWDRDLALTADVRVFPLADCLGLVHSLGKSGLLFFARGDHAKSVYFHRGEVVFATSNVMADRIGQCLLRSGVITLEQLREAEQRYKPPGRFGKVLVERGFLTSRELWQGVKNQVEELVRSLFSYTDGHVYFWEGEIQPDNVVRLSLPTNRLVAEGIERRDELFKFMALLEKSSVRLERAEDFGEYLEGDEKVLFDALSTASAFSELCGTANLDRMSAARTIQLLGVVGAVTLVRAADGSSYVGEDDVLPVAEDAVVDCVTNHVKLMEELAAPIVAVEGPGPLCERLQRVLMDTSKRFPQLLDGIRLGPHATLDPTEVTERALRVEGERMPVVGAALGELVAYLEFELKNHPRVREPEEFLQDLAPLRARLEL
jgi:hypothetical protein